MFLSIDEASNMAMETPPFANDFAGKFGCLAASQVLYLLNWEVSTAIPKVAFKGLPEWIPCIVHWIPLSNKAFRMLRSKDLPNLWMQFLDRPRGPSHSRGIPPIGRGAEKHLSCTLLVDSGHLANSALQLVMMVIHPKMILTSCRNVIHVSKSLTMSHTKIVIVCNTVRLLTYQKKTANTWPEQAPWPTCGWCPSSAAPCPWRKWPCLNSFLLSGFVEIYLIYVYMCVRMYTYACDMCIYTYVCMSVCLPGWLAVCVRSSIYPILPWLSRGSVRSFSSIVW